MVAIACRSLGKPVWSCRHYVNAKLIMPSRKEPFASHLAIHCRTRPRILMSGLSVNVIPIPQSPPVSQLAASSIS